MSCFLEILKVLEDELEILEAENTDILLKAENGIKITRLALNKVKEKVQELSFVSKEAEIQFFKSTKP